MEKIVSYLRDANNSVIAVCADYKAAQRLQDALKWAYLIPMHKQRILPRHPAPSRLIEAFRSGRTNIIILEADALQYSPFFNLSLYNQGRNVFVVPVCGVAHPIMARVRASVVARLSPDAPKSQTPCDALRSAGKATLSPTVEFPFWMGKLPRVNAFWSKEEDTQLLLALRVGLSLSQIAKRHGRGTPGIEARLSHLGYAPFLFERTEVQQRCPHCGCNWGNVCSCFAELRSPNHY